MEIQRKLKALDGIYAVYDDFLRSQEIACRMHCRHCCTTRVSLTTLEAYKIRETLLPGARDQLDRRLAAGRGLARFRPRLTTNALAELCAQDADIPPEDEDGGEGECPLLAEDLCSIYALRPFNCRCFVSRTPCSRAGGAEVDEFMIGVNTVFLQTIEHLDDNGCSGNLLDVLAVLGDEGQRTAYAEDRLHCTGCGLAANRPLTVLMVPPEHRARMAPVLKNLRGVRV
jgi:Fe-S-cluster containining protein